MKILTGKTMDTEELNKSALANIFNGNINYNFGKLHA